MWERATVVMCKSVSANGTRRSRDPANQTLLHTADVRHISTATEVTHCRWRPFPAVSANNVTAGVLGQSLPSAAVAGPPSPAPIPSSPLPKSPSPSGTFTPPPPLPSPPFPLPPHTPGSPPPGPLPPFPLLCRPRPSPSSLFFFEPEPCPPPRRWRPPPSPALTSCGCTGPSCRRAAALPTTTFGRTHGDGRPRSFG